MKTMNENNQIIIYQTEDGQTRVDVRMENETVWLSANQMAVLFDRDEKLSENILITCFGWRSRKGKQHAFFACCLFRQTH